MLEGLKIEVQLAHLDLIKNGLVKLKWGNISARDEVTGYIVIKPSGASLDKMKPYEMVVTDIDGNVLDGSRPSKDLFMHLEIYKAFPDVHSVIHTHSKWATIFAQAGMPIPNLGVAHSDYFKDDIPITRDMTHEEIINNYGKNTGKVIAETFEKMSEIDALDTPAVLVKNHASFVWGEDVEHSILNAIALEYVAELAYFTLRLNTDADMNKYLIDKNYEINKLG